MSEGTIRRAESGDWGAVATLVGRPAEEAPALERYVREALRPGFAWVASAGEDLIGTVVAGIEAPPEGGSGGGEDPAAGGERAAGTAHLGGGETQGADSGPTGRLVFLGVAPHARRRGLGRRLLDVALEELRVQGARRVTAEVDGTQPEALALLRAAGFDTVGQRLDLTLPADAATPAPPAVPYGAARPLTLADLPNLSGLLIGLGIERAQETHDSLPALTPAQVEAWLLRPATVAYAVWEAHDPSTPLGLAWATRRPEDATLRYVGVLDDARRQGIGRALIAALRGDLPRRDLRVQLSDPGEAAAFFRRLGFVAESVAYRLSTVLQPRNDGAPEPRAIH